MSSTTEKSRFNGSIRLSSVEDKAREALQRAVADSVDKQGVLEMVTRPGFFGSVTVTLNAQDGRFTLIDIACNQKIKTQ